MAMPSLRALALLSLVAVLAACGDSKPPVPTGEEAVQGAAADNPVTPGQTRFVTAEPGQAFGGGADGGVTGTPPAAPAPMEDGSGAPSGRSEPVEEADIYRFEGNRLFSLNTYRGLVIYDLSDPAKPRQLSQVPVFGYPTEMFVSGNTVLALFRDVLYLRAEPGGVGFERRNVSQLVSIDVTDVQHPRVLKRLDLVGQLREGVSRKVGNSLYVVSYFPQSYYYFGYPFGDDHREQAWVYSFDVSTPAEPRLVEQLRIFEGGSGVNNTGSGPVAATEGRYLAGFALSATSNTLHVVENWSTWRYASSPDACGSTYSSEQQAVVSIVDISDPTGRIRLHTRFQTRGHLRDQFKQTYAHDPATGRGTYFGIFATQAWGWAGCSGSQLVRNTLEAWDVTDGAAPTRLDTLDFGKDGEAVVGSAFDLQRGVAYAITARNIDPLYVISLADPRQLQVLSSIDGLSGDMSVFRTLGDGGFLLGVGRDTSSTCTGFQDPAAGFGTNVAVSIIDVRDLQAARLVQRRCVAVKDAQWVGSELSWNLDQAHKLIGLHSDGRVNLVTVPVSYLGRQAQEGSWWFRTGSAVGLMSWDLTRYAPEQSELQQQVLQNHGAAIHPAGAVRRSVVFTHQGETPRRMLLNLSDTHLSVVDIEDLSAPVTRAVVEVAPYLQEVYRFGDSLVEHLRPEGLGYGQGTRSEFRVKRLGGDVASAQPVAQFSEGQVARVTQWKDLLLVFRSGATTAGGTELVVYDFANPAAPVKRSVTALPWSLYSGGYGFWCGTVWDPSFSFSRGTDWTALDAGLVFVQRSWTAPAYTPRVSLGLVDLTRPEAPRVSTRDVSGGDALQVLGVVGDPGDSSHFYLSTRELVGGATSAEGQPLQVFRYGAQRLTAVDGELVPQGERISLPGQLTRAWRSAAGELLLSQDHRYTWTRSAQGYDYWKADPRLHLLRRTGEGAELRASLLLADEAMGELIADGDRLFLTTRPGGYSYAYGPSTSDGASAAERGQRLYAIDVSEASLTVRSRTLLALQSAQLMGHRAGRLFLSLPGDGVLVLDASDPTQLRGQAFLRTLGWTTHLEFSDDTLFAAAGHFGLFSLPLRSGSL